jgi:hypothetical protein
MFAVAVEAVEISPAESTRLMKARLYSISSPYLADHLVCEGFENLQLEADIKIP